jgi:hypothetical protein
LVIQPHYLDIGTLWDDDHYSWSLPVENREAETVSIDHFSTSCNCLSTTPSRLELASGEKRDVRLSIDLASKSGPKGDVSVRLRAMTVDGRMGPLWEVHGRVKQLLSTDKFLYLGRHSGLAQPLAPRRITIVSSAPLRSLTAETTLESLEASVEHAAAGKDTYVLTVSTDKKLSVGTVEGAVILKPVLADGQVLPPRRISVRGEIVPDLEAVPAGLQIGRRRLGDLIEESVTLRSLTGRPPGGSGAGDGRRRGSAR